MQQRYFEGVVQPLAPAPADLALREAFATARREADEHVAQLAFHRALESIWRGLDHANKYVTETAPFRLAVMTKRGGASPHGTEQRAAPNRGIVRLRREATPQVDAQLELVRWRRQQEAERRRHSRLIWDVPAKIPQWVRPT